MSKVRGQVPSSSQNDSSPSFVLETQFTVSVSFICAFNNCTLNLKPLIEAIYNIVQVSWLVKRVILFLIAKWASFDIHNHNCFFFPKEQWISQWCLCYGNYDSWGHNGGKNEIIINLRSTCNNLLQFQKKINCYHKCNSLISPKTLVFKKIMERWESLVTAMIQSILRKRQRRAWIFNLSNQRKYHSSAHFCSHFIFFVRNKYDFALIIIFFFLTVGSVQKNVF